MISVYIMVRFLFDAEVSEKKYWTKPLRDNYVISEVYIMGRFLPEAIKERNYS